MDTKRLKFTLLYVEDDEDTRKAISEVFALKVENLYVAKDGAQALEIFKKEKIHLIVSDYQMPNMNGAELCSAVKNIEPSIQFILLTAYNDTALLINAINSGVDRFLQKPIEAKKLFALLESHYESIWKQFQLEKSIACIKEAEKVAQIAYWDVDIDQKEIFFSQEVKEMFHFSSETIEYKDFLKYIHKEEHAKFLDIFQKRIYEDKKINEVIAIQNSSHELSYIHIVARAWDSSVCGTHHLLGLFQDITHYEKERLQLLKEAQNDPMLKISNKIFLTSELGKLIKLSQRYGHSIGVIFFDIDNFKSINEKYGHLKADQLLRELTDLIKKNIRESDIFGRWGGDEFVLVCGYSSQDATIELASKIQKRVATHKWECSANVTVTLGIAFYNKNDDATSIIKRADLKMLEAKKDGKNRYRY